MTQANDIELKKAALLIAKLLLRTREGKIQWTSGEVTRPLGTILFTTELEDGIQARILRDDRQVKFTLAGPPTPESDQTGLHEFVFGNQILSLALDHSFGNQQELSPEGIVYRDLEELLRLAENPKTVSDDLRFKQAMTYLDKLAV